MKFIPTPVSGVSLVEFDRHEDQRGSFRRLWCQREFRDNGVPAEAVQMSLSETKQRGTLRGMHFQLPPSREDKLVQCVAGHIYDVALDLRPNSTTFLRHFGTDLTANEPRALFIPAGCAHGFLTRTENCIVIYTMTDYYDADLSRGVRWNDPAFSISWPEEPIEILPRDAYYPDFDVAAIEPFSGD